MNIFVYKNIYYPYKKGEEEVENWFFFPIFLGLLCWHIEGWFHEDILMRGPDFLYLFPVERGDTVMTFLNKK